jgi:hypothetical protein
MEATPVRTARPATVFTFLEGKPMTVPVPNNDSRNGTAPPLLRRGLLGALTGGGVLLTVMLLLAGMAMALGWIAPGSAGPLNLTPWLVLELAGGAGASVLAGAVSRRIAGHVRGPLLLAAGVFTLGLLEATEILVYARTGLVAAPPGLVLLAPFIAAAGVLLGGLRPGDVHLCVPASRPLMLMREGLRYAAPLLVLASAAALSLFVLPGLPVTTEPHLIAAALSLDFTLVMPGLVRARRLPWLALVPAFAIGYALAVATIPQEHHTVLHILRWLVIPVELVIVGYLIVLMRKTWAQGVDRHERDFARRFRSTARTVVPNRIVADILTTEIAVLYYALRRDRSEPLLPDAYTVYREAGYLSLLLGLSMALLTETIALHVLVAMWSNAAAWVLTGLSLYAALWLAGDYRAMVARPIQLTPTRLSLRVGLRWEADLPISVIEQVSLLKGQPGQPTRDTLVLGILGQPNLQLRLREPVEVTGLYGLRRTVRAVWLRVDAAPKLCAALQDRMGR